MVRPPFLNQKSWLRLSFEPCAKCIPDISRCTFLLLPAPSREVAYNIAKVQNIHCIASNLKVLWYGSMEWNMEENFSLEWNMEWKIFSTEWKEIAGME